MNVGIGCKIWDHRAHPLRQSTPAILSVFLVSAQIAIHGVSSKIQKRTRPYQIFHGTKLAQNALLPRE
jgi:hypothetical protein